MSIFLPGLTTVDDRTIYKTTATRAGDTAYTTFEDVAEYDDLNPEHINRLQRAIAAVEAMVKTPTPLTKCAACGQWGAAYTECRYCSHPVDPAPPRDDLQ